MSAVHPRTGGVEVEAPRRPWGAFVVRRGGTLALAVVAVAATALGIVVESREVGRLPAGDLPWDLAWLSYLAVGAVVTWRRPDLAVGPVLVLSGATVEIAGLVTSAAEALRPGHATLVAWLAWSASLAYRGYALLVGVLLPLHLPDGRIPLGRARTLLRAGVAAWVVWVASDMVRPGRLDTVPVPNPLGWPAVEGAAGVVSAVAAVLLLAVGLLSYGRLVLHWRQASSARRQSLSFLALGALMTLAMVTLTVAIPAAGLDPPSWFVWIGVTLVVSSMPLAVGLAVLRTGLLDIELVLRRTLTYAAMTAVVLVVYAVTVLVVGREVNPGASLSASLSVTALAAVGLSPLRERAQRQVDRLLYGRRADPHGVLRELDGAIASARTPADVLPAVTGTIARALRLPYVAVSPEVGEVVGHGEPAPLVRTLELHHHGRQVGELLVSARSPGERLTALDDRLLSDVADHVASAVAAVALAEEAQQSRQRLVRALEDDRRRIRRDLHDHLGPVLSGITLQLDALRRITAPTPEAAELAGTIRGEVADALVDVRRLVHGLRPPVLDELGLVEAVRHHADLLSERLPVTVEARDVPPLPAAVEVAAYRIVTEALTNTVRHAEAHRATVRLAFDQHRLVVEVADDGRGIRADAEAGVGLRSMRERVAELGGVIDVRRAAPGTVVHAELPS